MNMAHGAWMFETDHVLNCAFWGGLFTPEECQRIVDFGESLSLQKATVGSDTGLVVSKEVRDSQIAWISSTADTKWIYERLAFAVTELNKQYFKFNLHGFSEALQFTRYDAPSGCYEMHTDRAEYGPVRKLSITLQLTDPLTYEGGDLVFYTRKPFVEASKVQGMLTVFPSFVAHEVAPVTKGTRHSLVGWVSGPSFV
jgi:PKHD-type hydroxylase